MNSSTGAPCPSWSICATSSAATWRTCLMPSGCRVNARCNRCSPNSTSPNSQDTWRGAADHVLQSWPDGGAVDLNAACHTLTLRALGRSVLGLDLDDNADAMGSAMHFAMKWVADRSTAPVRAPRWLPTPAAARPRGEQRSTPARRRDPAGVPCRSRPGRTASARPDGNKRPHDGADPLRQPNP